MARKLSQTKTALVSRKYRANKALKELHNTHPQGCGKTVKQICEEAYNELSVPTILRPGLTLDQLLVEIQKPALVEWTDFNIKNITVKEGDLVVTLTPK